MEDEAEGVMEEPVAHGQKSFFIVVSKYLSLLPVLLLSVPTNRIRDN